MALVKKNVAQEKMVSGEKKEGYLLGVTMVTLPPFTVGGEESVVPKLLLQDKKGVKFSVLTGSTCDMDVQQLTLRAWTQVSKKAGEKTRRGFTAIPWDFAQDDADMLPVPHAGA